MWTSVWPMCMLLVIVGGVRFSTETRFLYSTFNHQKPSKPYSLNNQFTVSTNSKPSQIPIANLHTKSKSTLQRTGSNKGSTFFFFCLFRYLFFVVKEKKKKENEKEEVRKRRSGIQCGAVYVLACTLDFLTL